MPGRIREWIALRNERIALEAMPDRLLVDIGIERAEIAQRLRHGRSAGLSATRPWSVRFRSAAAAFARELRTNAETDYRGDRQAPAPVSELS